MRILSVLAASSLVLALSSPAAADVINFGAAPWNAADGQTSFTSDGVTVSAGPCGALGLTWPCSLGWSTSGFGVDSGNLDNWLGLDDEISYAELLTVTFSPGTTINGFQVRNLFRNEFFSQDEIGAYRINNGSWVNFTGTAPGGSGGVLDVVLNGVAATTLQFGIRNNELLSDFSVASLNVGLANVSAVPEPSTMALVGIGLAAGYLRRRRDLALGGLRTTRA